MTSRNDREIPRARRHSVGHPLRRYVEDHDRDTAIARAYLDGGHTQSAVARATGLSVSRISRLIRGT